MSNILHKANEIVYVDMNVLLSTDYFVVNQIYKYLHRVNDETDTFYGMKLAIEQEGIGYENINSFVQLKLYDNPLTEFIKDANVKIADAYYNGIMYDDSYTPDVYYPTLDKTTIGITLAMLLKDANMSTIYVGVPHLPEALFTYITSIFPEKTKWNFVVGDKDQFLKEHECNDYYISDINTIKALASKPHVIRGNVYVPEYSFNMHPDVPVVLNSPIPIEELNKEYNLRLYSIRLPLF